MQKRHKLYKSIWAFAKRNHISMEKAAEVKGVEMHWVKRKTGQAKYVFTLLPKNRIKTPFGTVVTKGQYEFRRSVGRCVECGSKIQSRYEQCRELCGLHARKLLLKQGVKLPRKSAIKPPESWYEAVKEKNRQFDKPKPRVEEPPNAEKRPIQRMVWKNGVLEPVE